MKIFYIRYREDSVEEDGLWLFSSDEPQFFTTKIHADKVCEEKNAADREHFAARQHASYEKWQENERAYTALEHAEGVNMKAIFPYHKREFTNTEFRPTFVVDSIEVVEPS